MRVSIFIIIAFHLFSFRLGAQELILQSYVQEGIDRNLVLQEKKVSLESALNALEVAKSMYLPTVMLDITYSQADGGRAIDLPIGDLLNPVYSTLNTLTQSQSFPQIENEKINFLPKNYYDAKIRTTMPLIRSEIGHNREISKMSVRMQTNEVQLFKRELVKQIKLAYFNYLSTLNAVAIFQSSLALAKESLRVNKKKVDAGTGLPAYVIRANSEIAQVEAQLVRANVDVKNARLYFNALLNRTAHATIEIDSLSDTEEQVAALNFAASTNAEREELKTLKENAQIQEIIWKMNKQFSLPKVDAFLDLGSQAEELKFSNNSRYYFFGLHLSMPIFSGNRNKLKIQDAKIQMDAAQNKILQAEQQLNLALEIAKNNVLAAEKNYQQGKVQLEAAQAYQRLIQKGFIAGTNTYIETIDARSQYISAKLALNISTLQLRSSLAHLERESATYPNL